MAMTFGIHIGHMGADARSAQRHETLYRAHWAHEARTGFFRGTPQQVVERAGAYRDAGVQRLNIGLRQGPYDWEALHAFAEVVLPALGVKRP